MDNSISTHHAGTIQVLGLSLAAGDIICGIETALGTARWAAPFRLEACPQNPGQFAAVDLISERTVSFFSPDPKALYHVAVGPSRAAEIGPMNWDQACRAMLAGCFVYRPNWNGWVGIGFSPEINYLTITTLVDGRRAYTPSLADLEATDWKIKSAEKSDGATR